MRFIFLTLLMLVPATATSLRVATMNIYQGIEAPGSPGYEALEDVLARINADVVTLQEVRSTDRSGNPSNLDQLTNALGYPHVFVPSGSDFDSNNEVILMSKFPFTSTFVIGSPAGARDITRVHPAAIVDVPGTDDDPMIVGLHLKCCFNPDDFFRRAVEIERIKLFLDDQGLTGSDNIIVLGDFNLLGSKQLYSEQDYQNFSTLPATYELGNDISFPVPYYANPSPYFTEYPLVNPMPLQQNGTSAATFLNGGVLDYLMISQALFDRGPVLEVYNSAREASFPGLPKSGAALPSSASTDASDHYPIFGDFDLDSGLSLKLAISNNILSEGGSAKTLSVTLPQPASEPITVLLYSSDPGEAFPAAQTLSFPAGTSTRTTTLLPKSDKIIDGTQSLTILASAVGFLSDETAVTVLDTDTPQYELTAIGATLNEDFEYFEGTQTPAKWSAAGLDWLGSDDGSSKIDGLRTYGTDSSLGIQTGKATSITGTFRNSTGETISNLQINYDAEQWHSAFQGTSDRWEVQVVTSNDTINVPALNFTSDNTLASGAIPNGTSKTLAATISGLSIAPAADFQIVFNAVPGPLGSGGSDTVFLNELHYDNSSTDADEFIEVIVGSEFSGNTSDIDLVLYNGTSKSDYQTHKLSSFILDETTSSGDRIFSKTIPGIQNGSSDGIAIIHDGNVLQFLSYEGTLTAMSGPASGMTSTDIGVAQSPPQAAGQASLGLTGMGSNPQDFTWTRFTGPFTKGSLNDGQSLGVSIQSQGIAFDNLQVTALAQVDLPPLTIHSDFILTFPTQIGVTYQIQTSTDLHDWSPFQIVSGTGNVVSVDVSTGDQKRFYRVGLN